jgi:diaminohydroxyphosphoribosylaminopyrimidine deaminase / 5-amino-6-(5-phosphoribosylamino)uracil reductase
LKWAETTDGFVDGMRSDSSSPPLHITCDAANVLSHQWRTEESAILVGANTARMDNPLLTSRHAAGKNPTRIVIDRDLSLPTTLNLFNADAPTIIINEVKDSKEDHLHWIRVSCVSDIHQILKALWMENIQSVLVEGGPSTQHQFLCSGLWDEVRRFVSPIVIGSGVSAPQHDLPSASVTSIGNDRLFTYFNQPAR